MTNFRLFQTETVCNFKFNKKGRKFYKQIENTGVKGEIACYEQFLLFPQCFQKTCTADTLKPGLVWERVKACNFFCVMCHNIEHLMSVSKHSADS